MAPASVLPARMGADVQARLRIALFGAFTRASWTAQSSDREGHLQELMTNQVGVATGAALQTAQCVTAVLSLLVLIASALVLNPVGAAFVIAAALLLFGILRPLNEIGARWSRAMSQAQMNFASGVGEATRLAEETYVFDVAAGQLGRVEQLVAAARRLFFRTQLIGNVVPNIYRSAIYIIVVAGLIALNSAHVSHVAALGAVVLLLVRAGGYGQVAQGTYTMVRQALPYVERVQDAERRYERSTEETGRRRFVTVRSLTFDDVSYGYEPMAPVLRHVSFDVDGGEAIGIVGPSGAGKSTLVQLLLRLRAPQRGRYLVNGTPAAEFARADWYARVAYVPQEPKLLHASVTDNIRYFRSIDMRDVERAARLARIHDDIAGWGNSYDTVIGPRADGISGGQQQRICIARALAAKPQVLILDEPTSALDPQAENLLQESLVALKEGLTLIVVAHRLSTLDLCDRIMVIVDGRLEAFDTDENLRKQNAYYHSASLLAAASGSVAL
jgi:ATP-binding cassette subfamily B protein